MHSVQQTIDINRRQAEKAALQGKRPLVVEEGDIEKFRETRRLPFPNIGYLDPDGFEEIDDIQVQIVDIGHLGGAGITLDSFFRNFLEPGYGYAITETGDPAGLCVKVSKFEVTP